MRWELAFGADDSSWVVVLVGAFLCDPVKILCTFKEVVCFDMSFQSFGAHQRLGVIVADKRLGFRFDKRLLNGRCTCKRSCGEERDYGMHLD